MSSLSLPQIPPDFRLLLYRRRTLLGLWALCLIVYFMIEYAFVVPYSTVNISWLPHGSAVIVEDCLCPQSDDPGADAIQAGDILVAIDGRPVLNSDLHFRFGSAAPLHSYEFERGTVRFTVNLSSGTPSAPEQVNRLLPGVVALEAWLLGFLILLLTPAGNRDAWLVGLVMMGLAIALAAAPAAALGIPGSRLAHQVLTPIMSVGYVEMAFIPRRVGRPSPVASRILYAIAASVSALALIEIVYLNPAASWESITGIRLERIVLAILGLAILASPAIMAVRARQQASSYTRRQIWILLAGTGLALLPFTFLTALPRVLTGESWLPLEFTLPLLGAIPATYAYVIFRHQYLALDLFVARSISILLAVLLASTLFVAGYRLARLFPETASLALFLGAVFLLVGFGIAGRASTRLQPAIEVLLYGPDRHYDETLTRLRDELLADPQGETLKTVLLVKVPEALEVRVAALLLSDGNGQLVPAGSSRAGQVAAIQVAELNEMSAVVLHQSQPSAPIFTATSWARLAVALRLRDKPIGVLLLGEKTQGDYFDARDVAFVQRLAAWAGVAIENVQLFDAVQQMAADLLAAKATERAQLASRLHDEPLQRANTIARSLEQLSSALPPDGPLAAALQKQREEVRSLSRELRDISAGIRPPILDQGLLYALEEVIQDFKERFPDVEVERAAASEEPPPLSDEALDAAYHVVREAMNNVGKHAFATRVLIRVECLAGTARIIVSDDGRATLPAHLSLAELIKGEHHGIAGMHQWAKAAKGRMCIYPAQPHGTEIELTLPLNGSRNGI